jgi:hypothetical protein
MTSTSTSILARVIAGHRNGVQDRKHVYVGCRVIVARLPSRSLTRGHTVRSVSADKLTWIDEAGIDHRVSAVL